jgi:hypothetical protein
MKRFTFDDKGPFLAKLKELLAAGVPVAKIQITTPFPVHEALELLKTPVSPLKYFTFTGAFAGFLGGFALTIWTNLEWPIITGGKPIIALPPFLVIAFELTILLGAIASLLGFLHLTRLPAPKHILEPVEADGQFAIFVEE